MLRLSSTTLLGRCISLLCIFEQVADGVALAGVKSDQTLRQSSSSHTCSSHTAGISYSTGLTAE